MDTLQFFRLTASYIALQIYYAAHSFIVFRTVLVNQLLRSATSIGANLYEAQYAQSTNDFITKFEIAQKDCCETEYWLELLFATESIDETKYKKLQNDCGAIRRMLISSLKTIKSK